MKIVVLVGSLLVLADFIWCCNDEINLATGDAVERFELAFPFLSGRLSGLKLWQLVMSQGDYVGELNCTASGFPHGWGEMRWANGTLYGPGNIFIYSDGDRYFGQWSNGLQEGIGTFESRTGTYIGSWKSGLQNGNGTAIYHNGNRYDGQFKDGFKHGFGKFAVTTIGDVYTGHFERGMRHGHGIENYGSTGEYYVGNYVNDSRWGLGTAYYQDGSPKYIGPWVNGFPQGTNGTLFLQNGQKYVGEFFQGKPTKGKGMLYGQSGEIIDEDSSSGSTGTSGSGIIRKMSDWGLNLTDNKYSNLLRLIGNYVGLRWPFS